MRIFVENGPRLLMKAPLGIDSMPEDVRIGVGECPVCGRTWAVPPRYPFFVPHAEGSPALRSLWRRRNQWKNPEQPEVFWQWYDDFRSQMVKERPDVHFIPPGTSFGRLRLNIEHPLQLAKGNGFCLLARNDVVETLREKGIRLVVCPTIEGPRRSTKGADMDLELFDQEKSYKFSGHSYSELFAPAASHLELPADVSFCERCLRCENNIFGDWDPPRAVFRKSIPANLDLFVSYERPGVLMATERFVDATANLEVDPWVKWKEIEVV